MTLPPSLQLPAAARRRLGAIGLALAVGGARPGSSDGQTAALHGELSLWLTLEEGAADDPIAGALYIPELALRRDLPAGQGLDAVAAVRFSAFGPVSEPEAFEDSADAAWYRLWGRYTTERTEIRLGLQRISFGSAHLIRPLMWFDRLDPRDPLGLTEGVYALLGRHYFGERANVWAWGLYGNEDPKGWEVLPTAEHEPEIGGRAQVPLLGGEIGAGAHLRTAAAAFAPGAADTPAVPESREWRAGLDGRWDKEIGLWFEGALFHREHPTASGHAWSLLTLGADTTLPLGQGLHLLAEHLLREGAGPAASPENDGPVSALMADYALGPSDNLAVFGYYAWDPEAWSWAARWGHAFDRWTLYGIGFWNDAEPVGGEPSRFAGTGAQLLAVWNH